MRVTEMALPDNRRFGVFISCALGAVATLLYLRVHPSGALALALLALMIGSIAAARPTVLTPLNKAWMTLGFALGAIFSPIVLGILFFGLFTPIAVMMRIAGRDELRLRRAASTATHWRTRERQAFEPASFSRQF